LLQRLRVLESFVNVDLYVVHCLALAVEWQHVAVALGFVALALGIAALVSAMTIEGRGLDTCGLVNITDV